LHGSAGTGKTYICKTIVNYITDNLKSYNICGVAPTHKARRVLNATLNADRFKPIPTYTVAAVLGKVREHSYIGTKVFRGADMEKLSNYNFIIIDEISMISDEDIKLIVDYANSHKIKMLLIGDCYQLPCPSQKLTKVKLSSSGDWVLRRPDNVAFYGLFGESSELVEIVRQSQDSPIIKIATYIRDHMEECFDIIALKPVIALEGILPSSADTANGIEMINIVDVYNKFVDEFKQHPDTRMIAYTNIKVHEHNRNIRSAFSYVVQIVVGELITGYTNIGYPKTIIENGLDYIVVSCNSTGKKISKYGNLVGFNCVLNSIDKKKTDVAKTSDSIFIVNIEHSQNSAFMNDIVERSERVNRRGSTKTDFLSYCELKNHAVFMENIYKFNDEIINETKFKQTHPLLFAKVSEVIDSKTGTIINSDNPLTIKINDIYPDMLQSRLDDTGKHHSDSETFADKYVVIEKDIDYGYAITAHKSQGSTYHTTFVDDHDFKKLVNRWNHRYRLYEDRVRERNQLKYVAYTRASTKLYIIASSEAEENAFETGIKNIDSLVLE
jgi:hypothetical protein